MSATHLDALEMSSRIRERMADLAVESSFVRNQKLAKICRDIWRGRPVDGGLVGDLWVEGAFPAKKSEETLASLSASGRFPGELANHLNVAKNGDGVEAMPSNRPLYEHQLQAIRKASIGENEKPALVITAPTGAGKTESFLLPLLADLWDNPRPHGQRHGIRTLIVYPMNALIADQVERLEHWLHGQHRISFFHFNSETPEDNKEAKSLGMEDSTPYRFRTRELARGNERLDGRRLKDIEPRGPQPDILVTNYSMLEYMLCRPQDAVFFGPNLRTIVLDEAHLYSGTLAAELALLLRRVMIRCERSSNQILQIATSATLGDGNTDTLREFGANLFSKEPEKVHVIEGQKSPIVLPTETQSADLSPKDFQKDWLDKPLIKSNSKGDLELVENDPVYCEELETRLAESSIAVAESPRLCPGELLFKSIGATLLIHRLHDFLFAKAAVKLTDVSVELWKSDSDDALRATILVLQLAAAARPKLADYPLIPHRIHILTRPAFGLRICLNSRCTGPIDRKLGDLELGSVLSSVYEKCPHCESAVLTLARCGNCGEAFLAAQRPDSSDAACDPLKPATDSRGQNEFFWPIAGRTTENPS